MNLRLHIFDEAGNETVTNFITKAQLYDEDGQADLQHAYECAARIECGCMPRGRRPEVGIRRCDRKYVAYRIDVSEHAPDCATQEFYGEPDLSDGELSPRIFAESVVKPPPPPQPPTPTPPQPWTRRITFQRFCSNEFGYAHRQAFVNRQEIATGKAKYPLNQPTIKDFVDQLDAQFASERKTTKGQLAPYACAQLFGGTLLTGIVYKFPTVADAGMEVDVFHGSQRDLQRFSLLDNVHRIAKRSLRRRGNTRISGPYFAIFVVSDAGQIVRLWLHAVYLGKDTLSPVDSNNERKYLARLEASSFAWFKPFLRSDMAFIVQYLGLPCRDSDSWKYLPDVVYWRHVLGDNETHIAELRGYRERQNPRYHKRLAKKMGTYKYLPTPFRIEEEDMTTNYWRRARFGVGRTSA